LGASAVRSLIVGFVALLASLIVAAPASAAAPANDQVSGAQAITSFPASVPATTIEATGEAGETTYSTNQATESVWFKWTATVSGQAIVDLCTAEGPEAGFPLTSMAVYTGASETFAGLTKVKEMAGECKVPFAATVGVTYKIQVDFLHEGVNFTFGLRPPAPPANDKFATAQNLASALPVAVGGSTVDATTEVGEPAALGGSSARSVWFNWLAPKTGQVELNVCTFETLRGFAANRAVGVYTGATLGTLTKVAESNNCTVDFNVSSGTLYRIAFSGNFGGEGSFALGIVDAPKPANDNLIDATALGPELPLSVHGDNQFATRESGEENLPLGGFTGTNHSVWYAWTAPATQRVKLNSCGESFSPLIGVYTGTTIGTLVVATEKQSYAPQCTIELNAVAGTTYKIGIAAAAGAETRGPFDLRIHAVVRPANDNFADATPLGPDLPVAVDGDNSDATEETDEVHPSYYQQPLATVWYRWESSVTGPIDISTCGSAADDTVSVHTGLTFATMTLVAPSGEEAEPGDCPVEGQKGSTDRFDAVAGTTYFIQISGRYRRGFEGPFHLTIVDPNQPPAVVIPPPATGEAPPTGKVPILAPHVRTLKDALASCRARFKGKTKTIRVKRAGCIRRANLKFALAHCATQLKSKQKACQATARKKYAPPRPARQP
jgi:hypothetical protein